MRNKLVVLILALLPMLVVGQNVTITGRTNRPNALVRLLAYEEMFTCRQTQLVETHADKDGRFTLQTTVGEITPAQIAVNLERVDIILCPDGKYDLEVIIPATDGRVSYFEKEQPTLKLNLAEDGGFYSQYIDTELIINDFIYNNFDRIYRGRKLSLLDSLDFQIARNAGEIQSKYIKDFIKYRKAAVVTAVSSRKAMTEYFDNQEVLYLQAAYADAFAELFKNDVSDRDFLSRNQQLAELIAMSGQQKKYNANPSEKQSVLNYLENIVKSSKYKQNKTVAANLTKQVEELSYDSKAPGFALKDKEGKVVKLTDYQNDMVLLQFVDGYSDLLEHEFATLKSLEQQWADTIRVVTIATQEAFDDFVQLFDKQGFGWQLLNLGDNILLLEDYHVFTFPNYFILKKKGRVGMAPAPSPDHQLEKHVRRIGRYL